MSAGTRQKKLSSGRNVCKVSYMSKGKRKAGRNGAGQATEDELAQHSLAIITFLHNRVIAGAASALRKRTGLSVTEARVIFYIGTVPGSAANIIAKNLGLDKAAISRAVNRVIDLGLVYSEKDPDHSARNKLTITDDGTVLFKLIAHFTYAREQFLLSVLDKDEQAQFYLSLRRILTNVDKVNQLIDEGHFWE